MQFTKIAALIFLCMSAGLEAAQGATLTFFAQNEGENALDETVRIKIWRGQTSPAVTDKENKPVKEFSLKPGKSHTVGFSGGRYWAQAFDKDGNPVGDVEELKSRGFSSPRPGMITTMELANTDVVVAKKSAGLFGGERKVSFESTESNSAKRKRTATKKTDVSDVE